MKITLSNYKEVINKIGVNNLNEGELAFHKSISDATENLTNFSMYEKAMQFSPETKDHTELYFSELEKRFFKEKPARPKSRVTEKTRELLRKNREKREKAKVEKTAKETPTEPEKPKAKRRTKKKEDCNCDEIAKKEVEKAKNKAAKDSQKAKETAEKAAEKAKKEELLKKTGNTYKQLPEVQRIKRFLSLSKKAGGANYSDCEALYRALEHDAITQTIRRNSPYADEIKQISDMLVKIVNDTVVDKVKINLSTELTEKFEAIVKGKVIYWSVFFGQKIIRMTDNEKTTQASAKKLLADIEKHRLLISKEPKKNRTAFNHFYNMLENYASSGKKMTHSQITLNGGLSGIDSLGLTDFLSLISDTFGIAKVVSKAF